MYIIRDYNNSDYASVKAILEESELFDTVWDSEKNLNSMITNHSNGLFVALDNNSVIGCAFIISFGSKVAWIFRLAVKKDYRKHGVATQIITYAENILKNQGVIEIGLYVSETNKELQDFYKKRDFGTSNKPWIYMYKPVK